MSLINVEIRVVNNGVPAVAFTSARSVVDLERKFDCGALDLFIGESPRMEGLYWLAWRSLVVAGDPGTPDDFDVWVDTLEVFEVADDELPPPPPS